MSDFIENQTINGRAATVAYIHDTPQGFLPGTRDDYDLAKITFDDNGETLFVKKRLPPNAA
jgi:hypothetical protein